MRFVTTLGFLLLGLCKLAAEDGIYESTGEADGEEHRLTRSPELGASVWLGDLSSFSTHAVYPSEIDGKNTVVWIGSFTGDRPGSILVRLNSEVFAPSGILGPARLDDTGSLSSRGQPGRFKVTFRVKDLHEGRKLINLLTEQGGTNIGAEQDAARKPSTAVPE